MLVCLCCRSDHSFISTTFRDARAAFHTHGLKRMRAHRTLYRSAGLFEYATVPTCDAPHADCNDDRCPDRKAGYAVAPWRHAIATLAVMQIKDRAKSIKFASVCDNSAKARGKLLLYFRSKKSEKGGLKIANQNFIIDAEVYQVSGFAKGSGNLLKPPRLVACETSESTRNRCFSYALVCQFFSVRFC